MECSFCICLARSNKDWTLSAAKCHLHNPSKETSNSPSSLSSLKHTIKPVLNTNPICPVGFINKGEMCYANSILQVLSVVPNLCSRAPSESNTLLPMLQTIIHNMAVQKNSTKPVDPSNFFQALKCKRITFQHPARYGGNTASCFRLAKRYIISSKPFNL